MLTQKIWLARKTWWRTGLNWGTAASAAMSKGTSCKRLRGSWRKKKAGENAPNSQAYFDLLLQFIVRHQSQTRKEGSLQVHVSATVVPLQRLKDLGGAAIRIRIKKYCGFWQRCDKSLRSFWPSVLSPHKTGCTGTGRFLVPADVLANLPAKA